MSDIFTVEDLTGTFTVADIAIVLVLSFALSAIVAFVYRMTHRGTSYTQTYVQNLVLMGMVVAVVMLVVGSNIARAFALVGALSIVRFRNAIKETRDVGFIFFVMVIGMAVGTRFYALASVSMAAISSAVLLMTRFDWYKLDVRSQILKVQIPSGEDFSSLLDDVFVRFTSQSELVSAETVRGGALTELMYTVRLKSAGESSEFISAIQAKTAGQKVTLLTGYDQTDL